MRRFGISTQLARPGCGKIKNGTSLHFPRYAKVRYGGLENERDTGFSSRPFFVERRDMAKGFSYRFYHSTAWEQAREQALQRDSYLCQHCLARGVETPAVMVHHIVELTPTNINDSDISTNLANLVSLCDLCHKKTHGWVRQGSTRQGLTFDEDGNLISLNSDNTD